MDIGTQVPHAALRFYVMGERGADHAARPTGNEITRMGELLEISAATVRERAAPPHEIP
jgi:N-acyl-D-aspartate/D-glutamate deacylase